MELLLCTAAPPGGNGRGNPCISLPHCLGAVGSATRAMHSLTACRHWALELLQCAATPPSVQWAVPPLRCTATLPRSSGQCNSCDAFPHYLGALGSGTPTMQCHSAWGQWAMKLLQSTATVPWGSGQCNLCMARPHCPGGSGQCNSCNPLPHRLGAVGSVTSLMHYLTALGHWVVALLQ